MKFRIGLMVGIIVSLFVFAAILSITPHSPQYSILIAPTRNRLEPVQVTPTPRPTQAVPGNLLSNPSFEGEYMNCGASCNVAPGWIPYSAPTNPPPCIAGEPGCFIICPVNCNNGDCNPEKVDYGCWWCKPEHKAATLQFPERVNTGEKAQQAFCYGRQCLGGVYQIVPAVIGSRLEFSSWIQNWQCADNSGCGGFSDDPPTGYMKARIGIDPFGCADYTSPNIVWSDYNEGRDAYERLSVIAFAQNPQVTVFVEFSPSWGWAHIHNNCYWDDAALVVLPPLTQTPTPSPTPILTPSNYLPVIYKNYSAPTPIPTITPTPQPTPTPIPGYYAATVWFVPAIVTPTDTMTIALMLNTSSRMGGIEEFDAFYKVQGIEIIRAIPGDFFENRTSTLIQWGGDELNIYIEGNTSKRNGAIIWIEISGKGSIEPLTDYSVFVGTDTGGGITPVALSFESR